MNVLYTILLLICSNIFMTLAWYGHLKLQQNGTSASWPLIGVIVFSWAIAFFEYCCQVPANRIGFAGNGGPFSLVQLKVLQECISLVVFTIIAAFMFQNEQLHWNHYVSFLCLVAAVYFCFLK
ncbi:MAG: DMT family protein [Prevotella sp.]|nr:DMT family protein [Candidatus Equicola faecalis]MDO4819070.1 DMT family protein [Prevotella sp.]